MQLTSKSLTAGQPIPAAYAMGVPDGDAAQPGANRRPHLAWSGAPSQTRSFAITCVDADAPTKPDDVNKQGRTVPYDLPHAEFVHWVLVDFPASTNEIKEGADAEGMTARGKAPGKSPNGVRGLNDYTSWFKGDGRLPTPGATAISAWQANCRAADNSAPYRRSCPWLPQRRTRACCRSP